MWGSWMQIVKHVGDYPIEGIVFHLYSASFVLVWVVTFILAPKLVPDGVFYEISQLDPVIILKVLLGGGLMACGMFLSLTVMSKIGLLLATALSGSISSIFGLAVSIFEEGVPKTDNAIFLMIACILVFILASIVCNIASSMRDRDKAEARGEKAEKKGKTITAGVLVLILLHSFFTTGWSMGTAAGTANGLAPVVTCALMATGSFIAAIIVGSIMFTVKHEWKDVYCVGKSKKPIILASLASLCHYGGNIISIYSMPVISATLSFLFGRTSSVWTYFWGMFYGEFKGSKKKTYVVLTIGILLYFAAVGILGLFKYS